MNMNRFSFAGVLAVVAASLLAGCAFFNEMGSKQTEQLLAAAGFQARPASTAKAQALLAKLPPYQVQMWKKGKGVVYYYADPKNGAVWVGGPAEYQKYQQLSIQQGIAQDNLYAAEENEMAAMEWDEWDEFGPYWW